MGHMVEVAKQLAVSSGLDIDTYLIMFCSRGLYSRSNGVHGRSGGSVSDLSDFNAVFRIHVPSPVIYPSLPPNSTFRISLTRHLMLQLP